MLSIRELARDGCLDGEPCRLCSRTPSRHRKDDAHFILEHDQTDPSHARNGRRTQTRSAGPARTPGWWLKGDAECLEWSWLSSSEAALRSSSSLCCSRWPMASCASGVGCALADRTPIRVRRRVQVREWQRIPDSNRCYRRERPVVPVPPGVSRSPAERRRKRES